MNKKLISILLLVAFLLSACGGSASQPAIARIGWGGGPDTLNPGMAILAVEYTIFELIDFIRNSVMIGKC